MVFRCYFRGVESEGENGGCLGVFDDAIDKFVDQYASQAAQYQASQTQNGAAAAGQASVVPGSVGTPGTVQSSVQTVMNNNNTVETDRTHPDSIRLLREAEQRAADERMKKSHRETAFKRFESASKKEVRDLQV